MGDGGLGERRQGVGVGAAQPRIILLGSSIVLITRATDRADRGTHRHTHTCVRQGHTHTHTLLCEYDTHTPNTLFRRRSHTTDGHGRNSTWTINKRGLTSAGSVVTSARGGGEESPIPSNMAAGVAPLQITHKRVSLAEMCCDGTKILIVHDDGVEFTSSIVWAGRTICELHVHMCAGILFKRG